jgi:hypothetical protein
MPVLLGLAAAEKWLVCKKSQFQAATWGCALQKHANPSQRILEIIGMHRFSCQTNPCQNLADMGENKLPSLLPKQIRSGCYFKFVGKLLIGITI